jgi:hypothetical protein
MYFSSAFTVSTVIALATAIPTNPENMDSLQTRGNEACGLHWHSSSVSMPGDDNPTSKITVDWVTPTSASGNHHVQSLTGDMKDGMSLCNDRYKLCLTVNLNGGDGGNPNDGNIFRFGFGSDIWLSTDKPRCSNGKIDVQDDNGFLGFGASGKHTETQDGDCSFACKAALN